MFQSLLRDPPLPRENFTGVLGRYGRRELSAAPETFHRSPKCSRINPTFATREGVRYCFTYSIMRLPLMPLALSRAWTTFSQPCAYLGRWIQSINVRSRSVTRRVVLPRRSTLDPIYSWNGVWIKRMTIPSTDCLFLRLDQATKYSLNRP